MAMTSSAQQSSHRHVAAAPRRQVPKSAKVQDQEQTTYGILYRQLLENVAGLSPQTFQMSVPPPAWDWKIENRGFISAAQYDFCSVMPLWSAIGSYVSSGMRFNTAYGQFLRCIAADTTNPHRQDEINQALGQLTNDSSSLQDIVAQSQNSYSSDVTNNDPTYSDWLATPDGAGYQSQITTAMETVAKDQQVYEQLLNDISNPNLPQALNNYSNTDYYSKLDNPNLSGFPPVPGWSLSTDYLSWVNKVLGDGGQPISFSYSNQDQSYDYSKTWAEGAADVDFGFFQVMIESEWSRVEEFYTDTSLACTFECAALDLIQIQPTSWYSGTTALANGPYVPGYGKDASSGQSTYMFGEGGVIPLLKTGMLVCLNPKITVTVSLETYHKLAKQWEHAGGFSIGPFVFEGAAGGNSIDWQKTDNSASFSLADSSNIPKILGVTVAVQPAS
jgi:hypothetical protein